MSATNLRPLVLLHGWGMTPAVWQPLLARLEGTREVFPLALPGHTPAAPSPQNADWSAALLPAIPHGCVLCGWSLGSLLALEIAARWPQQVDRLVLFGATARFVTPAGDDTGLDEPTVSGFLRRYRNAPDATLRRFLALQTMADARADAVGAALRTALSAQPPEALGPGLDLLARLDLRGQLAHVRQPVRLIHGAGDALTPLAGAVWLNDHLNDARLSVLDDCGHAPFLSRDADCAALLQSFADE